MAGPAERRRTASWISLPRAAEDKVALGAVIKAGPWTLCAARHERIGDPLPVSSHASRRPYASMEVFFAPAPGSALELDARKGEAARSSERHATGAPEEDSPEVPLGGRVRATIEDASTSLPREDWFGLVGAGLGAARGRRSGSRGPNRRWRHRWWD